MAHDVFISYASQDKQTADAVCATMETNAIRCWIAPRDVVPGKAWAGSITEAMTESRVMVLVFSANANESEQISREVNLAANHSVPIIPFRIEDVKPSKALEYFISPSHWLDALTPTLEDNILRLTETVQRFTGQEGKEIRPPIADVRQADGVRSAFCRKCGERLLPKAKFCRKCGLSVG